MQYQEGSARMRISGQRKRDIKNYSGGKK